jgi:Flp pilus assembly protein TadD
VRWAVVVVLLAGFSHHGATQAPSATATLTIDYPAEGTLFPPDLTPPTMLWRDSSAAVAWRIEVRFADRAGKKKIVSVRTPGPTPPLGELDENCTKAGAVTPRPEPGMEHQHSWQPEEADWETFRRYSVEAPATLTITGFSEAGMKREVSSAGIHLRTAKDPVGAPVFFRDVPLISVPVGERGVIMPLPTEAIPLIAWRLRWVNERKSRLMMSGLPTCVNCHSFAGDGKTMGLDVDGPGNDKGLYGIVPLGKETYIRNEDVIRWSSFSEEKATKRFGFMSQISPNGRYVVTCIENPGSHIRGLDNRFYNGFYKDYGFGQVFYPTGGVLAWYDKTTGKLQTLPGADDPRYVQASAFWSQDGQYLYFSRAPAKEPYHDGQGVAQYANDPNETQIQYDLYRIPFNGGKGGQPEFIAGQNGMSNNFPKVSPDGRWVVFVQNRNGLLMRPDSLLYIVPAAGGTPRKLNCNFPRMNSWHSFSPNGKWLVFSSKGRSLYTQMWLTHIDENGQDSPPVIIENATAANRAVNIPEFMNIRPDGLVKMEAPATDFYRIVDRASTLSESGKLSEALAEWKKAVELDPEDGRARYNLALAYDRSGQLAEATQEYTRSLDISPNNDSACTNLGVIMVSQGRLDEAVEWFRKALEIDPRNAKAESNLGAALLEKGLSADAVAHLRKSLELEPDAPGTVSTLGWALALQGQLDESVAMMRKAVALNADSAESQFGLGRVLAARRNFAEAIGPLEKAVLLTQGQQVASVDLLAAMYAEVGRYQDALSFARRALVLATQLRNAETAAQIRARIERYENLAAGH